MDIKDSAGESSKRSEKHYRENLNFLWESLNHHEQTVLRNLDFKINANHTNTSTQESFSLVGEAEVRDSKHDRSTIRNGQLKDGGSHKLRNMSKSDPWSAAPSERMETFTPHQQDLILPATRMSLGADSSLWTFCRELSSVDTLILFNLWDPQQKAQLKYIGHLDPGNCEIINSCYLLVEACGNLLCSNRTLMCVCLIISS